MAARIVVMAGGTGGHVFPALAVAQELRAQGHTVTWLGAPRSFEANLVPQYDFILDTIQAYRLRGQNIVDTLLAPLRLLRSIAQAYQVLRQRKPDVLLGMGGFVSAPGGLAARILGIPLVIHEQNAIAGMSNRYLARMARKVLQAFPASFPAKVQAEVIGNPVRAEIAQLADPAERMGQRVIQDQPVRLFVIGGSLGAQALNEQVPQALALLPKAQRPQVCHQAGKGKTEVAKQAYQDLGVQAEVCTFMDDMAEVYAQADLLICRAGALTVSEIATAGVAAIFIPFPYAVDDHQTANAQYLVAAGAARLIQQSELSAESLAQVLNELCADRRQLIEMAKRARGLALPDAAKQAAAACVALLPGEALA
jgi:UDP-N-acetylglucosamine--N-acetylmuramyl-(pentapeptide) pyrophosphoryl-undecaprenol N-acetylglucosamine transferase